MTTAPIDEPFPTPRPRINAHNQPYWDALAAGHIEIQQCRSCTKWVHYPRPRCPHCGHDELIFIRVLGTATVHTFTVARQPTTPHFRNEGPQIIAVVELTMGVKLTTTLIADPELVTVGATVVPVFERGADGVTMLRYRLADSA